MVGFLVQSSVPTTNSKAAPSNTMTHWQMGLPSQAPLPLTALPLSNSPHQEHPPAPAWGCSGHLLPHRAPPTLTLEFYPVFFFFFLILLLFLKPLLPTFSALSQTWFLRGTAALLIGSAVPSARCCRAIWNMPELVPAGRGQPQPLLTARSCSTVRHGSAQWQAMLSWSQLPFSRIPKTGHRVTASFQSITKKKNKP